MKLKNKCFTIFKPLTFHVILFLYVKVQLMKESIVHQGGSLLVMKTIHNDKSSWFVKTVNIYIKAQGIISNSF